MALSGLSLNQTQINLVDCEASIIPNSMQDSVSAYSGLW